MVSKAQNSSQDLRLHTFKLLLFFFFILSLTNALFFSKLELIFSLRRHPQHSNRLLILFLIWILFSLLTQFRCVLTWLRSLRGFHPLARWLFVIVHGPLTPSCCSLLCPWPSAVVCTLWTLHSRKTVVTSRSSSSHPHPQNHSQPHFQWSLDAYNPVIHPPKWTQSWHDDYT